MKKFVFLLSLLLSIFNCQFSFGQWVQTSLDKGNIYCLAINGASIFAGTDNGIFLSTNNGDSWNPMNNGLPCDTSGKCTTITSLAINGRYIYAGTVIDGILLSTNNGASWDTVNTGLNDWWVNCIAVSDTNLFAGTGMGVYLSTNNGVSWNAKFNGLYDDGITSLATSGTNIFAGIDGGVYFSPDNGKNWTVDTIGMTNSENLLVNSLAICGTNIFAGTYEGGIFLSTIKGENWNFMNHEMQTYYSPYSGIYSLAVSGTNIFTGTNGAGVFLSTNNGVSWNPVNNGLTNTFVYSLSINDVYIFAGTIDSGVWKRSLSDILGVNESGIRNEESGIKIQPNPVEGVSSIEYQVSGNGYANVSIYDVIGNKIETLVDEVKDKGEYTLKYDAGGLKVGVYFVRLLTENGTGVARFIKE